MKSCYDLRILHVLHTSQQTRRCLLRCVQLRQKKSTTDIVYLPYMHFEQQTFIIRYTVDKADLSGELPGYASGQTASPHPLLPWSLALNDSLLYLTSIVNQEQERCLRYKGCSGEKGGENRSQGLPLCICL